jgi:ribonuclease R
MYKPRIQEAIADKKVTALPPPRLSRPRVMGITIDAGHSKDLDDAVWIERSGEMVRVWVSISDVGEVIAPHSRVFESAMSKGETAYFKDSWSLPMLPRRYAEQELSLLPGRLRRVVTIEITFLSGLITGVQIYEAVLSPQRLSYKEADRALVIKDEPFHQELVELQSVAHRLNRHRREQGAIGGLWLKNALITEDGALRRGVFHSQRIVAELMILANTLIAQWLTQQKAIALFRNHAVNPLAPNRDTMLRAFLERGDISNARKRMGAWLKSATYGVQAEGHFALSLPQYCHVTSPIRRGADLVVHHIVKSLIKGDCPPYTKDQLQSYANHLTLKREEKKQMHAKQRQQAEDRRLCGLDVSVATPKEFSTFLVRSVQSGKESEIATEILTRVSSDRLNQKDLYYLLFEGNDLALRQQILTLLRPENFTSVLAATQQISEWQQLTYVVEESPKGGFDGRVELTLDGETYTTLAVCTTNKLAARHQASARWVKAFVHNELINKEESEDAIAAESNTHVAPVSEQEEIFPDLSLLPDSDGNYIGRLLEYCQAFKWRSPSYQFRTDGPQNKPLFACTCSLTINGVVWKQTVATRSTKKATQHLAAGGLLNELIKHNVLSR